MSAQDKTSKALDGSNLFALGMVSIVLMLIVPIPAIVLDILLGISITISLLIFLLSINFGDPVEFSTFPTVLLIATMMRLALNIASTRLILLHGHEGPDAAGNIIYAFGQFVVGGSYFVGIIIFLVLVVINFKVITAGSGRIAEVAARFYLDAMPGKQMAIDNELANGHIDEDEARKQRKQLSDGADFYGAMDGANKFVKGDAVAGLIITVINILGGIIIGVVQNDLNFGDAGSTYVILTVGDGLVSQIPALLISTAAGLIASRTASGDNLAMTLKAQLLDRRDPLFVAGIALFIIGLFPGMPLITFGGIGSAVLYISRRAGKLAEQTEEEQETTEQTQQQQEPTVHDLMALDLLALEVGFDLVPYVDRSKNGELLQRIANIRKQIAQDMGIIVPPVRVRDNLQLSQGSYRLMLSGTPIGQGDVRANRLLAIDSGGLGQLIKGEPTKDPAFGLPALWIIHADKERAEILGYTVVDPPTVITTHLTELLRNHAAEFLGRAEAQEIVDNFSMRNPKLVEELIPTILPLGEVIKVLKNLLRENVSIRDLRTIFEALADYGTKVKDTEPLTELVRQHMSRTLTHRYLDDQDILNALVLDPQCEAFFRNVIHQSNAVAAHIDPQTVHLFIRGLETALAKFATVASDPVLIVSQDIRAFVYMIVSKHAPGLAVLGFKEIDPKIQVKTISVVKLNP